MCGLVGLVTKKLNGFSKEQCDAFADLLYVDALRGMDSTGVFLVDKDGNMDLIKEASDASTFRRHQDFKDIMSRAFQRGSALIGHNRAATRGNVIDANAHPFVVDDRITLVHNGTLWGNHKELADVEVDSHAIAHTIHKHGDDVEAAMQEIQGAYALIWHDFQKDTLNFLRNSQRPLNWIELEDCWMWASEANMLAWVIGRHNLKPVKDAHITMLPEGVLTTYTLGRNGWEVNSNKIKLERPKSYQQNWPGAATRHPYANAYWPDDDGFCDVGEAFGATEQPALPIKSTIPTPNAVVPIRGNHSGNLDRIRKEEQKICRDQGIDIPCMSFMEGPMSDLSGKTILATCVDFIEATPNNPQGGYYLYAKYQADRSFMVRCWVAPDMGDYTLLDLTLNQREAKFTLTGRQWSCYNNAADGQGFGMYFANHIELLTVTEKE